LKTINGGSIGDLLLLDSSNLSKLVTIVVNTSTGNILLNNDDTSFPLSGGNSILFVYKEIYGGYEAWCEQTRTVISITLPALTLNSNGITVEYTESSISTVPTFIYANPRGTGSEWFAVVDDTSKSEIKSYATTGISSYFTQLGESSPVIFNNIVTTLMTNMNVLFSNANTFNELIESWDTSNVIDMSSMFYNVPSFNQSLYYWNTSNVTNMSAMFNYASTFNQDISSWDTSNVYNMGYMFTDSIAFNQPLNSWNTSNVIVMYVMFSNASAFNQDISSWNTSNISDMNNMFNGASSFNQPLNSWNVLSVTNMDYMFNNASAFNQDISSWNTSNVINMNSMFQNASVFNQDISGWIISPLLSPNPPTDFSTGAIAFEPQNQPNFN
jgi:surface protein